MVLEAANKKPAAMLYLLAALSSGLRQQGFAWVLCQVFPTTPSTFCRTSAAHPDVRTLLG